MGSTEAKQKPGAVVGVFRRPGEGHNRIHHRGSWRAPVNAAIVVLLLSCVLVVSGCENKVEEASRYTKQGEDFHAKGKYRRAIGNYEKALAIDLELLGEKHPEIATNYNNLGLAWNGLSKYRQAIGFYEKALAILREAMPKSHPSIRWTEENLAAAKRRVQK